MRSGTDPAPSATTAPAPSRPPAPAALSVVIPTLGEVERLPRLLGDLEALVPQAEVVVVDGGSADGTVEVARKAGATVLETEASRGVQLRAGAEASSGRWLFFVHADCRVGTAAAEALRRFVTTNDDDHFAHFGFELDGSGPIHRFIEWGQGLRERWLGLVYGDQGLIVSRPLYRRVSGYPPWPLMEDVEMIRRLAARGRRIALPATLVTSSRRYDREGGLRRWMRNVGLMTLFQVGVDPRRLRRWYDPARRPGHHHVGPGGPARRDGPVRTGPEPGSPRRLLGIFAKAPTPGRVKTRLAADLGDSRATEIYRALGRGTVGALRGGPYRLVVFVDPPEPAAFDAVRSWLGSDGIELRGQCGGDLGTRMAVALSEALEEADQALLIGADIPGIDRATIARAFSALADHDVVLGPARDGGYYLVGLSRPRSALFRDVPWSTERVLSSTLERAEEEGLEVALLDQKTDVDTVDDLPPILHGDGDAAARPSPERAGKTTDGASPGRTGGGIGRPPTDRAEERAEA